jgi:hypothetical protein
MGDYSLTQQRVFSGGGMFWIFHWGLAYWGGESLFYDWYSPLANLPRTPLHTSFCIKSLLYKSNRLMLTFWWVLKSYSLMVHPKDLQCLLRSYSTNLQEGGLFRDLPISTMFTITVLMPFPLPST